jgi:hypothetical protein
MRASTAAGERAKLRLFYRWPVHGTQRMDEIAKSPRGRLFAAHE